MLSEDNQNGNSSNHVLWGKETAYLNIQTQVEERIVKPLKGSGERQFLYKVGPGPKEIIWMKLLFNFWVTRLSQQLKFSWGPQEKVISPLFTGFMQMIDIVWSEIKKSWAENAEFSIAVTILWMSIYREGVLEKENAGPIKVRKHFVTLEYGTEFFEMKDLLFKKQWWNDT